eukprot:CAMPEP_0201578614 /NCGR_PEP_ID=MMETSP0190_2-20130828/25577_1 /ASSEMBLY_ACC=CAM_ASM_000263 /TAXON_ID=37353 /ORGANISM="Rosalina sp." /LENGTH=977 /DNA_ID=CAMNT_0048012005 /DNA_START=146 /DNA_END=3079 /DNA_ORIENTATION=-
MAMQNQYMNQQFSVRNVVIENLSTKNIMARVSFQKSAMTRSNLESYNKVAKEKVVSGGVGVSGYAKIEAKAEAKLGIDRGDDNFTGAKAEAGASAEIGGGINVNASKSKGRLQETHDKQQYEMAVSAFEEEGWHMIKYGADKQFAVQGQLIYMSVMDPEDNKILIHNWTSTDNNFIYDGEDFDTKARWEKANKGRRKKLAKLRTNKMKQDAKKAKEAAKAAAKKVKEDAKAAKKAKKKGKKSIGRKQSESNPVHDEKESMATPQQQIPSTPSTPHQQPAQQISQISAQPPSPRPIPIENPPVQTNRATYAQQASVQSVAAQNATPDEIASVRDFRNKQFTVRNVVIENLSTRKIMARVSFQKSAISHSNLQSYNETSKERALSVNVGVSAKAKVGSIIPGTQQEVGGSINTAISKSKSSLKKSHQQAEYQMVVSKFQEEGWIAIKTGYDKAFAVQGAIIYISVMDPESNNIIVHNWTSDDNNFIWDGEDFDTKKRWEKANKRGRKKLKKERKQTIQAAKDAEKAAAKRAKQNAKQGISNYDEEKEVIIENLYHENIMVRVSSIKSAISHSVLQTYINGSSSSELPKGWELKYTKERKKYYLNNITRKTQLERPRSMMTDGGYDMALIALKGEGWLNIEGGKDRLFTKQGSVTYISLITEDNIICQNWDSHGNHFVWDGDEFDTKDRWQKGNKAARKKMVKARQSAVKGQAKALKEAERQATIQWKEDEKRRIREEKEALKQAKEDAKRAKEAEKSARIKAKEDDKRRREDEQRANQVSQLLEENKSLSSRLSALQTEYTEKTSSMNAMLSSITANMEQLSAQLNNTQNMKQEVEQLTNDKRDMRKEMETMKQNINQLMDNNNSLNQRVKQAEKAAKDANKAAVKQAKQDAKAAPSPQIVYAQQQSMIQMQHVQTAPMTPPKQSQMEDLQHIDNVKAETEEDFKGCCCGCFAHNFCYYFPGFCCLPCCTCSMPCCCCR